jgi:hypothetical protein
MDTPGAGCSRGPDTVGQDATLWLVALHEAYRNWTR